MKKRRLLSIVLCVILVVTMIAGCGGSGGSSDEGQSEGGDEKITLTFMGWQPELTVMNEQMLPVLQEKFPNINIEVEILEWFDYWDKLTINSASGDSADIVAMDVDHIPTFQNYYMGMDELAAEVMGEDWESAYTDGVLDDLRSVAEDGSLKMMPSDITGLWYIFYNKTICDELGVEVPNGEYDDLVRFVEEVSAKDPDILPVAFAAKEDVNLGFFYLWLATNIQPGIVKDAVDGKASFTDDAFVEAFEQLQMIYDDGILAETNFGLDAYPGCDEAMKNGNCAAYLTGEWYLGNYLMGTSLEGAPTENDEMGIVTFQNITGGETQMQKYASFGYSISNECEYKEEAMQVIQELTQGEAASAWLNYMATVPAAKDVTIEMENMKSDEAKNTYQKALDDLNNSPSVLRSTLNTELDNKIGECVVSVMRSGLSVDEALQQIQDTADSVR